MRLRVIRTISVIPLNNYSPSHPSRPRHTRGCDRAGSAQTEQQIAGVMGMEREDVFGDPSERIGA